MFSCYVIILYLLNNPFSSSLYSFVVLIFFLAFFTFVSFFFFQAEDGIRDADVTGVQTCALPIWPAAVFGTAAGAFANLSLASANPRKTFPIVRKVRLRRNRLAGIESLGGGRSRSEERRVGKEWRSRWWRCY